MLDRCRHDIEIVGREREDFLLARAVAHSMVPGAVEYIVTTFFQPPLRHKATTLVPPIVRPEIIDATSVRGDHLVVYSSGDDALLEALRSVEARCLVYGMRGGPDEAVVEGNLEFRPRSTEGFVDALRTARGVVAGRRLLAAQRGRLPRQTGALDPAARSVRAVDERALPGAPRVRDVRDRGDRRAGRQLRLADR